MDNSSRDGFEIPRELNDILKKLDSDDTKVVLDLLNKNRIASEETQRVSETRLSDAVQPGQEFWDNPFYLEKAREIAKFGYFKLNPKTNEVKGSREIFELFDIVGDKPLFEEFANAVHPDDKHLILPLIRKTIRDGVSYNTEHRVCHKNGTILHVHSKGEIIDSTNGLRLVGTVQDITESVLSKRKLEDTENKLRSLTDNAADFIFVKDKDRRYTFANKSTLEMMGMSESEVLGKTSAEILGEEQGRILEDVDARTFAGETVRETRCIKVGDQDIFFHSVQSPLDVKDGEVISIMGIVRDVTEQEKMREQMERSAKLDSLGVLAGGIAHDFNNLLGGIYGYINVAQEVTDEVEVTTYLGKTLATIDRARNLTRQLLTFAKGGAPIRKVDVLFPLVKESALFALSGSSVSCEFDVADDLWKCKFDENQITQVVENLMINAKQAMPDGGVIEVRAINTTHDEGECGQLPGNRCVSLSIKDTGVGIPKEILPRIFDPFYTTKQQGHGLGLSTCYSIVKRHGGKIEVESQPGKGTTFHVCLPACEEDVPAVPEKLVKKTTGSGTVVVMDDEEMICELYQMMLRDSGYKLVFKTNGEDTVDYFREEKMAGREVVAMILDLTIPGGKGGKEIIGEIRKLDSTMPVFVASGYAEDPVMARPSEFGFTASIPKPFIKAELISVIDKHLGKLSPK